MALDFIPEKYRDILAEIVLSDDTAIHFLWDCDENKVVSLGKDFVDETMPDPLEYLIKSGFISESSKDAFGVFASQIMRGIISDIGRNSLSIDVEMKLSADGQPLLCRINAAFLLDGEGRITAVHFEIRPFTSREVYDYQILQTFTSDKNPQLFAKRCQEMLDRHPDENVAFVQMDIERFKLINEKYGVEKGDELLKFIGETLGIYCGEEVPYARLTADVFMFVITFVTEKDAENYIKRLEKMLMGYNGMEYRLVFGIAIAEDRSLHTRRHGDNASLARQLIHGNALENIGWYNSRMKTELHKQQGIEDDMHKALVNGEFVMFLQPKHSISSGKIIGAEALARWNHPHKGMISPADFIPVFEKNGFILKLDCFIWESACKEIRRWIDSGIVPVPISVNISREYIRSFNIVEYLQALIKKYKIPAQLLELEITETSEAVGVEEIVGKLKSAGFKMLMDDFGSGYSSLNMLKTTQFDVLKIDREFLSELMNTDRGRKIIEHTISMSQDIGIDIVAEGVETDEQAQFLKKCGCDSAQGYFYSKPVTTDVFETQLRTINK